MRVGSVIGNVTLSRVVPELVGVRWLVVGPIKNGTTTTAARTDRATYFVSPWIELRRMGTSPLGFESLGALTTGSKSVGAVATLTCEA